MIKVIVVVLSMLLFACSADHKVAQKTAVKSVIDSDRESFVDYHYMMAYIYLYDKQADMAQKEYKKILPFINSPIIYNEYIDFLAYLKKYDDMAAALDDAINRFPDYEKFYLKRATIFILRKKYKDAIGLLKRANNKFKNDGELLKTLGFVYVKIGDYENGLKYLQSAADIFKNNDNLYFYIANIYNDLGLDNEAVKNIKEAIRIKPHFVVYIMFLGNIYEDNNEFRQAISIYLDAGIKSSALYTAIANDYFKLGQYYQSVKYYKKAYSISHKPIYIEKIAFVYLEQKRYHDIIYLNDKYKDIAKNSDRFKYILGAAYMCLKNYISAIGEFEKIGETSKIYADATSKKAFCYYYLGDKEAAVNTLKSALKSKPLEESLYFSLSTLYGAEGKWDDEIAVLKNALKKVKNRSDLYFYIADIYYEKKKMTKKSIYYLKKAISSDSKNANALNYLGYLYIDNNINIAKGIKLVKKALIIEKGNPYYLDSLGWGYFKLGEYKKAEKYTLLSLNKLNKLNRKKDIYVVKLHLAQIYEKIGKKKMAVKIAEGILKAHPGSEKAKAIIERLK